MSKRHTWLNRCGHAADRRLTWFAEPELSLHTWCCHKRCHRPPNNCGPHGMPAGKTIVTRAHGPQNLLIFSSSGPTNTHRPPAAKKTCRSGFSKGDAYNIKNHSFVSLHITVTEKPAAARDILT